MEHEMSRRSDRVAFRYLLQLQPDYPGTAGGAAVPRGEDEIDKVAGYLNGLTAEIEEAKDGLFYAHLWDHDHPDAGPRDEGWVGPFQSADRAHQYLKRKLRRDLIEVGLPIRGRVVPVPTGYNLVDPRLFINPRLASKTADSSWARLFPRNSYLNRFFAEKRIPSKVFEITDSQGLPHSIPNGAVVETIAQTRGPERKKIEDILRKIDFANGDVNDFLLHLAKGMAEQYSGALRYASGMYSHPSFRKLKQQIDESYGHLVDKTGDLAVDIVDAYEATRNVTSRPTQNRQVGDIIIRSWPSLREWFIPTPTMASLSYEVLNSLGRTAARGGKAPHVNKYDPNSLLAALVWNLEKEGLDDAVRMVKGITPNVQRAWETRGEED